MHLLIVSGLLIALIAPAYADGDAAKGARVARTCIVCHAFDEGQHMTGPSLHDVFGRKAGSVSGFDRYSKPLRESELVWNRSNLETYLADPQKLVPGTTMTALVESADDRGNLIAFLEATQSAGREPPKGIPMPRPNTIDLKSMGAASQVSSIRLCRDTYKVTMENGATLTYWEHNLRFKTDSSSDGPKAAKPVLLLSGMHGDRAYVIFARPEEISASIKVACE